MYRSLSAILLLGVVAVGATFQQNATAELLEKQDLATLTGKACYQFISHDCTTASQCLHLYPDCDSEFLCGQACSGPGSHRYCLDDGSFYETCTTFQQFGCGFYVSGLTCAAGSGGGCLCTGQGTVEQNQCGQYEIRDTTYCGG